MISGDEEGPHTTIKVICESILSWGRALLQKRHSSIWVMNRERNFEDRDLMKRISSLVQVRTMSWHCVSRVALRAKRRLVEC